MRKMGFKMILFLCLIFIVLCAGLYYFDELGIKNIAVEDLKTKYEKKESKYIKIDGTNVHYCDEGEGPVIVALHGIVDSLHTWDGWVNEIGSHYRIVRMDIPGFGLTGPLQKGTYSKETFVEFVDKFVSALNIHKFTLAGNSLGGAIAWNYSLQFPEKVDKMILIDPAGYSMKIPWPLRLTGIPIIKYLTAMITPRFIYAKSVKQVFGDPEKVTDDLVDRFYELSLRPGNRSALLKIMATLKTLNKDPLFTKSIAEISVPTMLLWGEKDKWIPVSHVKHWQKDVPGIHTIIYEGVGHVPQIEIPVRSANDAHNWLHRNKQPDQKESEKRDAHWFLIVTGCLLLIVIGIYFLLKK